MASVKEYVMLDEEAESLGVGEDTRPCWTRRGELACVQIGKDGDKRFRQKDLDTYIKGNRSPKK